MSISRTTRGLAVHHNGLRGFGLTAGSCNGRCVDIWAGIRRFHVNVRGWRDVAYSFGVCPSCGRRLTGRGWGVRTAANGTNKGNSEWHAVMVLQGGAEVMTDVAKTGVLQLAAEHEARYGRTALTGHGDIRATECPGPAIRAWLRAGAPSPVRIIDPPTEEADVPLFIMERGTTPVYQVCGGVLIQIPNKETVRGLKDLLKDDFRIWAVNPTHTLLRLPVVDVDRLPVRERR